MNGRRSGRERTVPVAVLRHEGERCLVSYRGLGDWALDLRATPAARLATGGRTETITDRYPGQGAQSGTVMTKAPLP
ncbi:nitroreductase/quinone reductase family protein [Streptomyces sviceus]|uniref:nitroreductase/quinone reductase family protein n=1 Tax=Streptomyces sviceus TaxID=285530 RepID=UPI0036E987A8